MVLFFIATYCLGSADIAHEMPRVTIFIHGTHLGFYYLQKGLGLGKYVEHQNGLYPLKEFSPDHRLGKMAKAISHYASHEFPLEHFYIFCWSGELSHSGRLIAAQELHKALKDIMVQYGKKCVITLVTHSHGGNVALNLAAINDYQEYDIDKLILLAIPVQQATQHYVENGVFKNVFSIYSRWDITQIGDLQGFGYFFSKLRNKDVEPSKDIPLFSQRVFPSEKVKHIEVRQTTLLGYRPIGHLEFLLPHFTYNMSTLLENASKHDFYLDSPMIFNIKWSLFYSMYFGN